MARFIWIYRDSILRNCILVNTTYKPFHTGIRLAQVGDKVSLALDFLHLTKTPTQNTVDAIHF